MWGWRNRGEGEEGWFFAQGSASTAEEKWIREHGSVLAGVKSQCRVAKQSLKRPAGGEVNANAASRLTNAGADFEELGAQSFDLCRTPRLRQLLTEEVDHLVAGALPQQPQGSGQAT